MKSKKRDAAVQAIITGSAALFILTVMYLWIRIYITYGFWIPTLMMVATVMAFAYVSTRED